MVNFHEKIREILLQAGIPNLSGNMLAINNLDNTNDVLVSIGSATDGFIKNSTYTKSTLKDGFMLAIWFREKEQHDFSTAWQIANDVKEHLEFYDDEQCFIMLGDNNLHMVGKDKDTKQNVYVLDLVYQRKD